MNSFCSNFRNFITVVNCGFKSDVIHGQAYRERKTVYSQAGAHNGLGLHSREGGWLQAESGRAEDIDDLLNALPSLCWVPVSLLVIYVREWKARDRLEFCNHSNIIDSINVCLRRSLIIDSSVIIIGKLF